MGQLHTTTICLSIRCPVCGEMKSVDNRRGFKQFMVTHMGICEIDNFDIQGCIEAEWVFDRVI